MIEWLKHPHSPGCRKLRKFILFTLTLLLCLILSDFRPQLPSRLAIAQSPRASQQVQQGVDLYRSGQYWQAIEHWEKSLENTTENHRSTDTLKYLARAYQQVGQTENAIDYFEQLITHYRQTGYSVQLARILIEQAQAYSDLGQQEKATGLLCGSENDQLIKNTNEVICKPESALKIAQDTNDKLSLVAALGSLGNVYRLQGKYTLAIQFLEASLNQAQNLQQQNYISAALNSLGNVYASLAKQNYHYAEFAEQASDQVAVQQFQEMAISSDQKAIQYFQETLKQAQLHHQIQTEVRTRLNLILPLARTQGHPEVISDNLEQVEVILNQVSDSQEKAYFLIKLANLIQLEQNQDSLPLATLNTFCSNSEVYPKAIKLLNQAIQTAQNIKNNHAQSLGLGYLGHIYECQHHYQEALNLTQQAQLYERRPENLYQWDWQAGRIFKAQENQAASIQAYEKAVKNLKKIRGDLAIASRELQLDFQEAVEPVYRELTELYLSNAQKNTTESDVQIQLNLALDTIDELRLAELQNYLGNECELPSDQDSGVQDLTKTAIFRTIILPDKVAIILTLQSQNETGIQSRLHWIAINQATMIEIINDFRLKLEKRSDRAKTYRQSAELLYDWFIRPFLTELENQKIETLVFVQDGILRTIPMGALSDGIQFLIQQYAIANLPTLAINQLTSLEAKKLKVLAVGLTEPSAIDTETNFAALENVQSEVQGLQKTFPDSQGLLNEDFTVQRLEQELEVQNYSILHLATHAQFGFDARQTFLVTGEQVSDSVGNTYNQPLRLNQLYQLIQNQPNALALLTLTACETAAGSSRDALGLAGVALQAGAESAVASLWQVDDLATVTLILQFYQNLQQGMGRAKALQLAQTAWLDQYPTGRYNHPGYWAAFIEIGNWF